MKQPKRLMDPVEAGKLYDQQCQQIIKEFLIGINGKLLVSKMSIEDQEMIEKQLGKALAKNQLAYREMLYNVGQLK